jgi:GrpB-like predicted nucleotidyltransferase (UPF0157 family)
VHTVAVELIGGVERRSISVVDADASWPRRFAEERTKLADALGSSANRIDHIGSTAVPHLAAKAIIDVQVSVDDLDDERRFLPAMQSAGYVLRVREPGHRMLRTATLDVHVHVCASGSEWERRHLLFRDWLRRDRADRSRYEQAKLQLARHDWPSMNHYADAKSDVISEILSRAETWAQRGEWSVSSAQI